MSEQQREFRELVCILTDAEKAAMKNIVVVSGINLNEITESLKEMTQDIKAVKQRQAKILDCLKFGQEERPVEDGGGRMLLDEITEARRAELEDENLELLSQLEDSAERRKALRDRKKTLSEQIAGMLKALRYGQEERDVECEWRPHFSSSTTRLYRLDTGACIDSRPLSDEEAQQAFEFEEPPKLPRVMTTCHACGVMVGATSGVLDQHSVGGSVCLGAGLTTQQAADLAGQLSQRKVLPSDAELSQMVADTQSKEYAPGRDGLLPEEPVDELDEAEFDAGAELPGLLSGIGKASVSDIQPGDLDGLMALAGVNAQDLAAYLLAQPSGLKPATKRLLKTWGK